MSYVILRHTLNYTHVLTYLYFNTVSVYFHWIFQWLTWYVTIWLQIYDIFYNSNNIFAILNTIAEQPYPHLHFAFGILYIVYETNWSFFCFCNLGRLNQLQKLFILMEDVIINCHWSKHHFLIFFFSNWAQSSPRHSHAEHHLKTRTPTLQLQPERPLNDYCNMLLSDTISL